MRTVFVIALNDLRRRLRDRTALAIAFLAPFGLAAIMGIAFGSGDNATQVRVAIADADNTATTRSLVDHVLQTLSLGPGVAVVRTTDVALAKRLYDEHRVSASIALVPTSSDLIEQGKLPGMQVQASRTRPLGKAVADAFVAGTSLRVTTAVVVARELSKNPANASLVLGTTLAAIDAPPAVRFADDTVPRQGSPLGYFAPAMGIIFLFISVGAAASSVLAERSLGTMARLQAAPSGLGVVVAGKTVSIVGLMIASMLSLWGATTWIFGAHWGSPGAVVALILATVAAVAAIGLFVTVSARTEATAQVASAGVAFVLAILGGSFFPPGSLPPWLEKLSLLTPNGWSLDGFTTLSLDGGHLRDVLLPLAVLVSIAAVVGTTAIMRFRRALAVT
jgi:ABC-2 type transport system permease protein